MALLILILHCPPSPVSSWKDRGSSAPGAGRRSDHPPGPRAGGRAGRRGVLGGSGAGLRRARLQFEFRPLHVDHSPAPTPDRGATTPTGSPSSGSRPEEGERYMEAETVEVHRDPQAGPLRAAQGAEYRNAAAPVRLMVRLNGVSRTWRCPPVDRSPRQDSATSPSARTGRSRPSCRPIRAGWGSSRSFSRAIRCLCRL